MPTFKPLRQSASSSSSSGSGSGSGSSGDPRTRSCCRSWQLFALVAVMFSNSVTTVEGKNAGASGGGPRVRVLPPSPTLWSPSDLAHFLRSGQVKNPAAAEKVLRSVQVAVDRLVLPAAHACSLHGHSQRIRLL